MIHLAKRFLDEIRNVYRVTGFGVGFKYTWRAFVNVGNILTERSLRCVDLSMGDAQGYTFRIDNSKVLLPGSAFGLGRELIGRNIYEFDSRFAINDGDRVLDLGANIGVFSVSAAARGADVIAVEAQSGFSSEMNKILNDNNMKSVQIVHGILAPGGGVFASLDERRRSSHWQEEPTHIDPGMLLKEKGWDCVDFIKCDIEGAEFELFMTTDGWLGKVNRIAMEVHTEFGDVDKLAEFLRVNGFEVVVTDLEMQPVNTLSDKYGYLYAIKPLSVSASNGL
jgi:FkbM family methyltransferase